MYKSLLIRLVDFFKMILIKQFYTGGTASFGFNNINFSYLYIKNIFKSFYLIGIPGIIYANLYAITHICFVYSIQNTAVRFTLVLRASGATKFLLLYFQFFILKD